MLCIYIDVQLGECLITLSPTVWVVAGWDGVAGPLAALGPGALRGPVGEELRPAPALAVLHPLLVTREPGTGKYLWFLEIFYDISR